MKPKMKTESVLVDRPRWKIVSVLVKDRVSGAHAHPYIEIISALTDISPRMVSHHADVLEDAGLVESTYVLKKTGMKRGVAVRQLDLTEKGVNFLNQLRRELDDWAVKDAI
jgi:DNA-binding transcriptional ArsR family regulator